MSTQHKPASSNSLDTSNLQPVNDNTMVPHSTENINLDEEINLDTRNDITIEEKAGASSEDEKQLNDLTITIDENNESKISLNSKDTYDVIALASLHSDNRPFLESKVSETQRHMCIDKNQKFPTVLKAALAGNFFSKHVCFVIQLPNGSEIKRRYNDFVWLRDWLVKTYLGAFIPPIPERLIVAKWPKGYLQTRMRELQVFLKRCSTTPFIVADATWIMWGQSGAFDKARKKWDKNHSIARTTKETCEHLATTFPHIMDWPLPDLEEKTLEDRFEEMKEFVDDSLEILQRILQSAQSLLDTYKLSETDSEFAMREGLMEYEKLTSTRFSSEPTETRERLMEVLNKTPPPIFRSFVMWSEALYVEPTELDLWVHNIKINLMDFQVVKKCIAERVKVLKRLQAARNKAQKSKKNEENLTEKQDEELPQDELEMLSITLHKLVTKQFSYVWQESQYRFSEFTKRLIITKVNKYHLLSQIWQSSIDVLKENSSN